jgi:prevent-host-death family protein
MKQVNLYEARTRLSSLVDEAAAGEEILIAKNGKALARLSIVEPAAKRPPPPVFQTDFSRAFAGVADDLGADTLPIELKHIDRLSRLPLFHRDPFDRLIIAQSLEDDLTIMTRDRAFSAYPGLNPVTL